MDMPQKIALMNLYRENPVARALFDHLKGRGRNIRATSVDRLLDNVLDSKEPRLRSLPEKEIRTEIQDMLKELAKLHLGSYVIGRRGHKTRFEWRLAGVYCESV